MTFEEFKNSIMDTTPISDGLKFNLAVFWLHPSILPVGVVGMDNRDSVVRIPQWHKNEYGNIVSVIAIANEVLGNNPNMTDLILPPSINRFTSNTFKNCHKLKRLTFPKAVKCVPEKAFADCTELEDVYYEGSKEEWDKIDIVYKKDEYIVDKSKLGLYCNVTTIRRPLPGNEPLFKARIHFDCDLGSCTAGEFGVYLKGKPLPLLRMI